jgi:VanZ family protein
MLFIIVWIGAIFILTCTSSFRGLMESGVVRFAWDPQPVFTDFLRPLPARIGADFLTQKIGHVVAFFILTGLLQSKLRSNTIILLMAIFYASLTEYLQLYFSRDGRLFDVGFDTVGILFALGVGSLFTRLDSWKSIQK